jgi:hypothetical protein
LISENLGLGSSDVSYVINGILSSGGKSVIYLISFSFLLFLISHDIYINIFSVFHPMREGEREKWINKKSGQPSGVIHRGSQTKQKGWRRAEVVEPRKRLLGRQERGRALAQAGAGRPAGAHGAPAREPSCFPFFIN